MDLSDTELFHMCVSDDIAHALQCSLLSDFHSSFFGANKQKYKINPANTFRYRVLTQARDLGVVEIGEQLKRRPDTDPVRKLAYAQDIIDHRHYIAHHKLKVTPWERSRMQTFADKGRGDLDFKPALLWNFLDALVELIKKERPDGNRPWRLTPPQIVITAEMETMTHEIFLLCLDEDAIGGLVPIEFTREMLNRFRADYIRYCNTTDPVRESKPLSDEEYAAFLREREQVSAVWRERAKSREARAKR